jgi:hypothetical protein
MLAEINGQKLSAAKWQSKVFGGATVEILIERAFRQHDPVLKRRYSVAPRALPA